ncbi:ABC transporter ATP-binding protein [Candidatus Saccharibacteria bacterium]|nr:ABC transporter ATP-binding protein [Candidatus Saccharibacteria bacterium]
MTEEIAIKVDGVYKDFALPHEKANSLKSSFLQQMKGGKRTVEKQHALKDISFEVKKGEFFGIVGRNGSGKSTLLKILAQIYKPTKGTVSVNGRLVPFIELGVGFNPELTGKDNVYLSASLMGFSKKEIDGMYNDIVDFAELEKFMDQKLKNYSSGMQVRLAFSIATRVDTDILLIDEVLAVGDADFQRKCFNYFKDLKARNKTVVFVSHDMSAIREYCDRAILIERSELNASGQPTNIARKYAEMFIQESSSSPKKSVSDDHRWGTGEVRVLKADAIINGDNLFVNAKVQSNAIVDKLVYGVHILGQDGSEITAVNNRMISEKDILNISPGSTIDFKWQILNIFNDGDYSVTLTLVDNSGRTLDWLNEAANFTVKRRERSTTAVLPPIIVKSKISK